MTVVLIHCQLQMQQNMSVGKLKKSDSTLGLVLSEANTLTHVYKSYQFLLTYRCFLTPLQQTSFETLWKKDFVRMYPTLFTNYTFTCIDMSSAEDVLYVGKG